MHKTPLKSNNNNRRLLAPRLCQVPDVGDGCLAAPQLRRPARGAPDTQCAPPWTLKLLQIVVTGRANVGKSTLMNAVMGRVNLCLTSKKAGRTQMLNFFRIGPEPGKLILVDAPGYGDRGRQEWGALFDQYLQTRTELRRVFVCVNGTHGLNDHDRAMLQQLDAQCQASGGTRWTLQAIITKADALAKAKNGRGLVAQIQHAVFEAAPTCLPAIVTAAAREPHFGIDEVRNSVAEACALR